jgi:hypothetical protein
MMSGYHRQPDKTREAEWYAPDGKRFIRTGDVGRFDADGFLTLMDRRKDMIISGGFNVYPSDLEAVLIRHPAVAEVAVVGVASERWGETPVAFRAGTALRTRAPMPRSIGQEIRDWANLKLGKTQRLAAAANRRCPAAQRHRQDPQARTARQFRFAPGPLIVPERTPMEFSTLEVTLDAGVATIALNRPDKANAMSEPMWYEIEQAMEWLDEHPRSARRRARRARQVLHLGHRPRLLMGLGPKIEDDCDGRRARSCAA